MQSNGNIQYHRPYACRTRSKFLYDLIEYIVPSTDPICQHASNHIAIGTGSYVGIFADAWVRSKPCANQKIHLTDSLSTVSAYWITGYHLSLSPVSYWTSVKWTEISCITQTLPFRLTSISPYKLDQAAHYPLPLSRSPNRFILMLKRKR